VTRVALNCDSSRFATIDHLGFFNIYNLTENKDMHQPEIERKEVWNVVWSKDSPLSLATNEKQRIVFIEDQEAEPPIQCDSYVCQYSNMQLTSARIEKLMKS
jgi:WD repeat-containing protein 35